MKKNASGHSQSPDPKYPGKAIERAKQELERMIDLNPHIMLLSDRDGRIMRANRAMLESVVLRDFRDVLGKDLGEVFRCKDPQFFSRLLSEQGGCDALETEVEQPDGRTRTLQFTAVGQGKKPDVFVLVVRDVTLEKEQAADLEKAHKKEAVHALAGALMHHISQPLTVIMVKARLIQMELEGGAARVGELKESLQDIMNLTTQIADMLQHAANQKDYVTKRYLNKLDILDITQPE